DIVEKYQNKIIVIDFWAPWCSPCLRFAPVFEKAQKEIEWADTYVFVKLDVDKTPAVAQQYSIQAIPTMAFIKNKELIHRQIGAMRKEQFYSILKEVKETAEKTGNNTNGDKNEELSSIRKKKEDSLKQELQNQSIPMPKELIYIKNAEHFNDIVEKYQNKIIVIDFWAPWCAPCKMFAPVFERAQKNIEWADTYVFVKLDTDSVPAVAQQFAIQAIPTMAFLKNKQLIHRQIGAMRKEQFFTILKKVKEAMEKA
ncbi:MAG: thioredoxin family protein, partial [Promethearchaeota archaeon]